MSQPWRGGAVTFPGYRCSRSSDGQADGSESNLYGQRASCRATGAPRWSRGNGAVPVAASLAQVSPVVTSLVGVGSHGFIQQVSPTDRLRRPLASALTTVKMRNLFLALFAGLIGVIAVASPLKPWNSHLVAATLAWSSEIANNKAEPSISLLEVKLISVPLQMGECWGKVNSCPDEILLISAVEDGLYKQPVLFRLPKAKAWAFVRWLPSRVKANAEPQVGFIVRTGVPGANIDESERERFRAIEYEIWLTSRGGSFVARRSGG